MDPKIAALQNASTSTELKVAVDDIPREQTYYTAEIRDLFLQKQNLIVDAPIADAVVSFVRDFSGDGNRDHVRNDEIRDLIIDVLAPRISAGDPVCDFGRTICYITCFNFSAAKLYSNRKSFSAILGCFYRATTAESVCCIADSIHRICDENPGANKILNDLPVVEAYSTLIPYATTDDSVRCISTSMQQVLGNIDQIFKDNEPARQLFGTLEFLEKFRSMGKYAKSHWTKDSFRTTMGTLQSAVNHSAHVQALRQTSTSNEFGAAVDALPRTRVFFTAQILDAILEKKNLIIDTATADAVVVFLSDFLLRESARDLLCTPEIRDLIIDVLAPKISEGVPVQNLGRTIHHITDDNKPAAELYSNRKSLSTILDCFPRATTTGNVSWIVSSIYNICFHNPGANKILNDLPVVEAYSAIIPFATSRDSVERICKSIDQILEDNESAQKMCATLDFFENFTKMEKYATSDDARTSFKNVVDVLDPILEYGTLVQSLRDASSSFELKDAVAALPLEEKYYTVEIRDLILQKKNLIVDSSTADIVVSFLQEFSYSYDRCSLLLTPEIRDLIIDVLAPKISDGNPVENLGRMISNIASENRTGTELYSNRKSLSAILDCFHRATATESVCCIACPINDICFYDPDAKKIIQDLPFVEAYSAIILYATRDEAIKWISVNLLKLWNSNDTTQKLFNAPIFFEAYRTLMKYVIPYNAKKFPCDEIVDILRPFVDSRVLTDAAVPSTTSATENDALISQLREQIEVLQQERAAFERERAEHQRTRNLLELLLKEKESGKRRQREDE